MENTALNSIVTELARKPPEDRVQWARDLEETMSTPGWDAYMGIIDQLVTDRRRLIEWAPIAAYEEMISRASALRGILTVQAIPEAVAESAVRAHEELRQIVAAERTE